MISFHYGLVTVLLQYHEHCLRNTEILYFCYNHYWIPWAFWETSMLCNFYMTVTPYHIRRTCSINVRSNLLTKELALTTNQSINQQTKGRCEYKHNQTKAWKILVNQNNHITSKFDEYGFSHLGMFVFTQLAEPRHV